MRNFSIKRFTASLLLIVMLVAAVPATLFDFAIKASAAESESTTVIDAAIFFSDLHTSSSNYKESTLKGVLNSIKNNHSGVTFTSITSGGDAFSVNADSTKYTGKTATLNGYINSVFTEGIDINYVWSDHDRYAVEEDGSTLLDKTSHLSYGAGADGEYGTADDGNYYVYTLSMGDLCSYDRYNAGFAYSESDNSNRVSKGFTATVSEAIANFEADAAKLHKDRPLFIVSHQPLFDNRNDNAWAEDWFDAINTVAEEMDVAFFYGHNHKYDTGNDYYYAKGTKMPVATADNWGWDYDISSGNLPSMDLTSESKTLNFTHMCMGYLAPSSTGSTSDTTREGTALAVTITADSINYVTYNASGKYTGSYAADYTVKRDHAKVVSNNTVEDSDGLGIIVIAPGITAVNASKVTKAKPEGYAAYLTYDINPVGYTSGDTATVIAPVDDSFDPAKPVQIIDGGKVIAVTTIADGKVTFTTNHFSEYALAQLSVETSGGDWVTITEPIPETPAIPGSTTYKYVLDTDGINTNTKYLIVNTSSNGDAYVLTNNNGSVGRTPVTISNGEIIVDDDTDISWTYSSNRLSNNGTYLRPGNGTLFGNATNLTISNRDNGAYYIYRSSYYVRYRFNSWTGSTSSGNVYLFAYNETITTPDTPAVPATPGLYGKISGALTYNVDRGTLFEDALKMVKDGISIYYHNGDESAAKPYDDDGAGMSWELDERYNGTTPGEFAVNIYFTPDGGEKVLLGTAKVVVPEVAIVSQTLNSYQGEVPRDSESNAKTGATISVVYEDGTSATVDVTLGMLEGSYDITKNGTYSGLTVVYGGTEYQNFTLKVTNRIGNDFPEYPDPGAVKVNKVADANHLQDKGLVNVELSTSGLPVEKGVDVIVMLDLSSSMTRCVTCNEKNCTNSSHGGSRLAEMEAALVILQEELQKSKNAANIKVAIADFNGVYTTGPSAYNSDNHVDRTQDVGALTNGANDKVHTGSGNLDAGAFVSAASLDVSKFSFTASTGTNYDYAFDAVYQLGYAIKQENIKNNDTNRDLYVIFMSDGAANQFNYYNTTGGQSGTAGTADWDAWLTGNVGEGKDYSFSEIVQCQDHIHYFDETTGNQHRMANAIKGDPDKLYEVIRKNQGVGESGYDAVAQGALVQLTPEDKNYGKDNMYKLPGLGATTYTLAFYVINDGNISAESAKHSLKATATSEDHYIDASVSGALAEAFSHIGGQIAYAATDAYFVDQMGHSFDIQMGTTVDKRVEGYGIKVTTIDGVDLEIEVINYEIYTSHNAPSPEMVGQRTGKKSVLETIKFKETMVQVTTGGKYYSDDNGATYWLIEKNTEIPDGAKFYVKQYEAYSDKIDSGNTNILVNGIITAKNFWYNTTANTVKIDTNADGTADYDLLTESFYWNIGTINNAELALSYWLYLTGSMEGNAPAGSYKTNESAILYYVNWLGNSVKQETTSPQTGWESANVSYAFYLVNKDGQPVVNQTTGQTGSFYEAVKVTTPVIYQEILLNNIKDINTIQASSNTIRPDGYELYDASASYKIVILSVDGKGSWTISYNTDLVQSTYVTGFSGTQASSAIKVTSNKDESGDDYTLATDYDYTHTVVWFALVWVPSTIPDQVVIDYGLPVDISVLGNDQFGKNGTLNGIGLVDDIPIEDGATVIYTGNPSEDFKNTSLTLTFGVATMIAPKVRYTPKKDMNMTSYDQFAYEVKYNYYAFYDENGDPTSEVKVQYYYGTVTVIPATTIYYEESFVAYDNASLVTVGSDGKVVKDSATKVTTGNGAWTTVGTVDNKNQNEDRPGQYSLPSIDANSVYGFDSIYKDYTTYSLGSASKVTVHETEKADNGTYQTTGYNGYAPKATFTFTGTGFDVISLTDSDAGMILVTVKKDNTVVKSTIVANYYGMSYDATTKTWKSVDKADGQDTIWQVPVIKMDSKDLGGYGTYTVEIQLVYMPIFDLDNAGAGNKQYDFILDSIRIYDPAGTGVKDGDTTIEDAYKADNEYNPKYFLIRDMLVGVESGVITNATGDKDVVFIDGIENATLEQYKNPGPNNEVYLAYGQSIAFNIAVTFKAELFEDSNGNAVPGLYIGSKPVVNIGAKIAYGGTITVGLNADKNQEITTTTDMYYTMPLDWAWTIANDGNITYTASVVLTNTTENTVLSLTNIKITENTDEIIQSAEKSENTSGVAYKARSAGKLMTLGNVTNLTAETVASEETIRFYVDQMLIDYAASVMSARFAPEPEAVIFTPEVLEHTVISGWFGINTVRVITSKDVASVTVNGVEATKLNDSKIVKTMLKLLDKLTGNKNKAGDYYIWTVTAKNAASYDIVAYNAEGVPSDPAIAESAINVGNNGAANKINREEIEKILKAIAEQHFDPEQFKAEFHKRFDGKTEIVVETSDEVSYVIIGGKIVKRFITETVIDTETGETTTKRVWITDAEEGEEVDVNVYDEKGVGSESKKAGHKGPKEDKKNEKEEAKEAAKAPQKPNKNAPKETPDAAPKANNKKNNSNSVIAKFFNM